MRAPLAEVIDSLDYQPLTGRLIWRKKQGNSRADNMFNGRFAGKEAGCIVHINGIRYRQVRISRKLYQAHQLIFFMVQGRWPNDRVDHEDRDGLNNRWSNLREASAQQNQFNRVARADNPGRFKGVRRHRDGVRWQARITVDYRSYHLGLFRTEELAAAAYDEAAISLHGSFAKTNAMIASVSNELT